MGYTQILLLYITIVLPRGPTCKPVFVPVIGGFSPRGGGGRGGGGRGGGRGGPRGGVRGGRGGGRGGRGK